MIKAIITDLDNTLYDWITYYANSLEAMAKSLSNHLQIDIETLYKEFKIVYIKTN